MKTKTVKIALEGFGSYLGMEKGCFIVKNREGCAEKYPLFENLIDEIKIKSGNSLSSGALASCGFWGIDCLFLTQKGKPVAMLRSLDDDSHADLETRERLKKEGEKLKERMRKYGAANASNLFLIGRLTLKVMPTTWVCSAIAFPENQNCPSTVVPVWFGKNFAPNPKFIGYWWIVASGYF